MFVPFQFPDFDTWVFNLQPHPIPVTPQTDVPPVTVDDA